jgi:hypothetical protein
MKQASEQDPPTGRRAFTRVPFHVRAQLRIHKEIFTIEKIRDISLGGCFLLASPERATGENISMGPGDFCTVYIALTGTTQDLVVEIDGEIARSGKDGIAVKFTTATPENLYHLQNIIRYNAMDADTIEKEIRERLIRGKAE